MQTFTDNDNSETEIEKGFGIQHQLRIWDSLLEIRIQLQKLLVQSNNLPRCDALDNVIKAAAEKSGEDLQLTTAAQQSRLAIRHLMDNLLELQSLFTDSATSSMREIIQKWNDKTQVASGKLNKNNFSAFQISTLKQIDHILSNKERLLKRTQVRHSDYDGSNKDKVVAEDAEDVLDEEIFNDDDFFHQMLKELIENSVSNSGTSEQNRHYLELQKLRSKLKRKIDTKASKGRKIRYDVHSKLVNFMAPYEDKNSMSEIAKTELYKSVFKNLNEWKGQTDRK